MPSRKQRRRREKLTRHEYELVEITPEGKERPVERAATEKKEKAAKPQRGARSRRPVREVPPPSWQRALRRALPWQLGMLALIVFVFKGAIAGRVAVGVLYAILFVPLIYLTDRFAYRTYLRRSGQSSPR